MDLHSIGQDLATNTYDLHIVSPTGQPLYAIEKDGKLELTTVKNDRPMIWTIVGKDSPAFRAREAEVYRWAQQTRKKKNDPGLDELEQKGRETVATAIVGWKNTIWRGKDLPFSIENVLTVLDGYRPAYDQVDAAVADRGNFSKSA